MVHTVASWNQDTVITILLKPNRLPNLLDKLGNMPEVEKVEEEPLAKDAFSSFPKQLRALPSSRISPSKRVHVTLKETSMLSSKRTRVVRQRRFKLKDGSNR